MNSKRHSSTTQPLVASALLAVAFVVTTSRNRSYHELSVRAADDATVDGNPPTKHTPRQWFQRLAPMVDQQLVRLFHCAVPNGLAHEDFDLGDLTR